MSRGTPDTRANRVAGEEWTPAAMNDALAIATTNDDALMAELYSIRPPASVTPLTPSMGIIPLGGGPLVVGSGIAREVTVRPLRAVRSSIDVTRPGDALSGVTDAEIAVALPTAQPVGKWRMELLYAQLGYRDPVKRTQGTQVLFRFAPTGVGGDIGSAPTFATLPQNVYSIAGACAWNVPIAFVKNLGGAVAIATEDIMLFPGVIKKLAAGIDARRAYSSTQDPRNLVVGGPIPLGGSLTPTITPAIVGRPDTACEEREILLPKEITGGTAGFPIDVVIDDTRDWRGANFKSIWVLPVTTTAGFFGEDDNGNGTSATRQAPSHSDGGGFINAFHMSTGQSHEFAQGSDLGSTLLVASELRPTTVLNTPPAGREMGWAATTDRLGLIVDDLTGTLRFRRKIAGAGAGVPIYCVLQAWFPNHRP